MDLDSEMCLDDLITHYFKLGLHQGEILSYLRIRHNAVISRRKLQRHLSCLGLFRKKHFNNIRDVRRFLLLQLEGSGKLHGYKWMHLKCLQHGLVVTQKTVRLLLRNLDNNGVNQRSRNRLRRRRYFNKGPNYLWHLDGYDKLKPYGVCISGCIDGYSRYLIWLTAAITNNNPAVIAANYVTAVLGYRGCPISLRADLGTENTITAEIQTALTQHYPHEEWLPPFLYGASTHNQRIEAWWGMLRKQNSQFWMNLFEELKDMNYFNGTFLDKSLIQYCFLHLIQDELNEVRQIWNSHKIRRTRNSRCPNGRPMNLFNIPEQYGTRNYLIKVTLDEIEPFYDACLFLDVRCTDKDVQELCDILMNENNYTRPTSPTEAMNLYIRLRSEIMLNL